MNSGVTRPLDALGRVVLPAELRNIMGIKTKDSLAIYTDDKDIILKKYEPGCIFCNNADGLISVMGKTVCRECAQEIKAI